VEVGMCEVDLFFFFSSSSSFFPSSTSYSSHTSSASSSFLLLLLLLILLLLLPHYNSDKVLAISTISFHLRRSWTCSISFIRVILLMSFLTSSSHRDLGPPAGLLVNGFHLHIFLTILVSDFLFVCANQLNI
jgi:hypothetical protein